MLVPVLEMLATIIIELFAVCVSLCVVVALILAMKFTIKYALRFLKNDTNGVNKQLDDNQYQDYQRLKQQYPRLKQANVDYQQANHNLRVANDDFQLQIRTLKQDVDSVSKTKALYETRIQHLETHLDQVNQLNASLQAKLELDNQYRVVQPPANLANHSDNTNHHET